MPDDPLAAASRRLLILEHELWRLGKRRQPDTSGDDQQDPSHDDVIDVLDRLELEAELLRIRQRK